MSSYTSPTNNYNLQGSEGDRTSQDPLSQQQQHGISPVPPYHFNPHTSQQHQQAYEEQPNDSAGTEAQAKGNRLRKACDSCSIRKVKCDESGPPCRACAALDIPCTFERPSRRRGPPNRHAESIKRRKLDPEGAEGSFEPPASPNNAAATLASFSSHAVLSAESICPFPLLELLVDDFFTYIHPLTPFPHEPSFRAAFKHREDLNNPPFLALLASMIGALVASFPRRPKLHLKAQHGEKIFRNSMSLVERCHKVAVEARGAGYLDRDLTVYDAATSYFLALASGCIPKWRQMRLYLSEALSMIKVIGASRPKDEPPTFPGPYPAAMGLHGQVPEVRVGEPIDFIKQEIGRRLFWVILIGVRSMQQIGSSLSEFIIAPSTPHSPYPPLPLEVDDQYIFVDHIDPQPPGIISELTGFNLSCKIHMTCNPIVAMEVAYGINEVYDWNCQKQVLGECLQNVKLLLDDAPAELKLSPGSQPGKFEGNNNRAYFTSSQPFPDASCGLGNPANLGGVQINMKRYIQNEIQKANVFASQIGTRSYIVERFWNMLDCHEKTKTRGATANPANMSNHLDKMLRGAGSGAVPYDMGDEAPMNANCEIIINDLLSVLNSINQVNMEPNGENFIHKIRQITSMLLGVLRSRKGSLATKAEGYLATYLDILIKLDPMPSDGDCTGGNTLPATFMPREHWINVEYGAEGEYEAEELRNWAELREFQIKSARASGFLNGS